jgi:uncharacterized protein YbjT (DUF2867 family)
MGTRGQLHAVVAGATGLVGTQVVEELIRQPACSSVSALVRSEPGQRDPKLQLRVIDYDKLEPAMFPEATGAVFCCLGTTINKAGSKEAFRKVDLDYVVELARLARARGVDHFLVISSLGASAKSRLFYNRVKGMVELELRDLDFPHLSILRPSLLLGEREETRVGEEFAAVFLRWSRLVLIGRWRKYRAIAATTVARAMVHIALHPAAGVSVYESDMIAKFGEA